MALPLALRRTTCSDCSAVGVAGSDTPGVEVHEGQVIQLALEVPNAHAMGQQRKDVERFLRYFALLLGFHVLERAHVVQTVFQLDHDDPVVVRHGNEYLLQII